MFINLRSFLLSTKFFPCQTRTPGYTTSGIKYLGGISTPCQPLTPAVIITSFSSRVKGKLRCENQCMENGLTIGIKHIVNGRMSWQTRSFITIYTCNQKILEKYWTIFNQLLGTQWNLFQSTIFSIYSTIFLSVQHNCSRYWTQIYILFQNSSISASYKASASHKNR
jgi:hypothetical protein